MKCALHIGEFADSWSRWNKRFRNVRVVLMKCALHKVNKLVGKNIGCANMHERSAMLFTWISFANPVVMF